MRKTIGRIAAIVMTVMMLFAMIPASAMAQNPTTNGSYTNGVWSEGGTGSKTYDVDGTPVTLSKTVTPVAGQENVFDVTLQVQTQSTTTATVPGGAVVLVVDVSNSMKGERLSEAKKAAKSFLASYAKVGDAVDANRQLSIVTFAHESTVVMDWQNVAGAPDYFGDTSSANYEDALKKIDQIKLPADYFKSGTNLEAGLEAALKQLKKSNVANKSVVLLSDGAPTLCNAFGNGSDTNERYATAAKNQADKIKSSTDGNAALYTICYGAMWDDAYYNGPSVSDYLKNSIATPASGNKQYAFNVDESGDLASVFVAIAEDIEGGLSGKGWTATDPMGKLITVTSTPTAAGFTSADGNVTWTLDPKSVEPEIKTEGNVTTYIYTYTVTYRVTLDVLDPSFDPTKWYPTNERTYLTVGEEELDFPVPAVKGLAVALNMVKKDAVSNGVMANVAFKLAHNKATCGCTIDTEWSYDGKSNENGVIEFANLTQLPSGHKYTLTETTPTNYQSNGTVTLEVENGVLTVSGNNVAMDETGLVTIKNTPETITIEGSKTWDDNNDQDGKRPESITIHVMNGDTVVETKTVTASDDWKWSFTNLPKVANGELINYTITEEAVDGYTATYNGYNVTNTHTPATTSVTVTKVWDDAENQDGKRPASLIVTLSNDQTVTLNETNSWTATIENLPKYANGVEINYTWTEGEMPEGYALTSTSVNGSVTTLTNSYEPEVTSATVAKVWDDAENQDGKRPASLTVTLSNGQTVTLNETNSWTATIGNLPKYANGVEINYTWTEGEMPEGYALTSTSVNGTVTTLTNTHTPATVEVAGSKTWDDNNDQDGKRPESITINLLADGTEIEQQTVNPNDEGNWTWSFTDLPKYANGQEITYTITEEVVADYSTTYDGYNVINSYTPGKTTVPVTKVWDDANNQDGIRPNEITVKLLADGVATDKTLTLSAANNWTGIFTDLDEYSAGKEIEYTVKEVGYVTGYNVAIDGSAETGFTITNTHEIYTTGLGVAKEWADNDDQDGMRPESVTVKLLADGKDTGKSVELTEANKWNYYFNNLPAYENGKEIVYTVEEVPVAGYTAAYKPVYVDEVVIDGYIITNTHNVETTSVKVSKVWIDENNQYGYRPNEITVRLYTSKQISDMESWLTDTGITLKLNAANNWTASFTGLPKYKDGMLIEYAVDEIVPDGYEPMYTGNQETGFTVVNTLTVTPPPKTGDSSNIALWMALMAASALCIGIISKRRSA